MKTQKHERGQSLVELSISLLVLLYLLSGAVEFGLAFFQFVQLRDAAQEGALYGSMSPGNKAAIELRVRSASTSPVDLADPTKVAINIQVDGVDYDSAPANTKCESHGLQVTVSYNHQIFMPFIPQLIGSSTIPLNANVTDTILTPPCP